MPQARVKFRTLKIFLIRDGVTIDNMFSIAPTTHENTAELTEINQDIIINITDFVQDGNRYYLVLKRPKRSTPSWGDLFPATVRESYINLLFTASAAAVLIVCTRERTYALAFGRGRYLLKPDAYERDFGLRVVLNSVNPEYIRSIDTDSIDDFVFHATKQSSKAATIDSYELKPQQELLKGVAGVPKQKFGSKVKFVAGADVLALNVSIKFKKIGTLCEKIYGVYIDDAYKDRFGFIDNLRIVKDPTTLISLNEILIAKLNELKTNDNPEEESITVAPPDVIDFKDIEGICFYSIYKRTPQNELVEKIELNISEWISSIGTDTVINLDEVKKEKVAISIEGIYIAKWSLYNCLVFEAPLGGKQYILSNGLWYNVDDDIAIDVDNKVSSLIETGFSLIDANNGEHEGPYNERLVASNTNAYILMDRKNIKFNNSVVEFCDVICDSAPLQFIHIKRKTQSATLSHLFAQGRISGTLFKRSAEFRVKVSSKIQKASVKRLINFPGTLDMSNYKIVYAIVAKSNPNWPKSLPFFSKLNLKNTAEELELLGYQVSLLHITQL